MSEITLRPAVAADFAAITAIYAEAVETGTATFELDPPSLAEMTARFDDLAAGGFPWLVAVADGKLMGYAYAGPYRARPAYRFTVENSIYLATEARRRGIGLALLERLVAETASRGFRQMIAVIGDSANAASIAVHARAGFQMVGTFQEVGFKFGRWLDTVLMQRAL
ncbi:MAG: N-acetyltransferase family protein [Xanthobacteraceae bacterium]